MQSYFWLGNLSRFSPLRNFWVPLQGRLVSSSTMSDSQKRLKTDTEGDLNQAEAEPQSSKAQESKNPEVTYPSRRKPKANASADLDQAVRRVGGVPLDISDFYFEEEKNLRKVRPYFYNYKSNVKHRWIGQTIESLMRSEFSRSDECELVVDAGVEDLRSTLIGSFRINGQPVTGDYVLKNGDKLDHIVHRHENPILTDPIRIVSETEELLAIDKPSSMPIHACGRYCLNSALHIMARDMDRLQLRNVHRLDRLTSGLVILAKQQRSAMLLAKQIRSRRVRKVYLCKVYGQFPQHLDELLTSGFSSESILRLCDARAFKVERSSSASSSACESNCETSDSQAPPVSQMQDAQIESDGEPIVCDAPIARVSPRIGVHFVPPSGDEDDPLANDAQCGPKPCRTLFRRVAYCPTSNTSLVRCEPLTGRTHQIRVHAQYLGYPLVGDPIYGAPVWGTKRGRMAQYDTSRAQLGEALYAHHARISWFVGTRVDEAHIKLAAGQTVELAKTPAPDPAAAEWLPRTDDDAARLKAVGAPLKYFPFEQSCPDCRLVFRDPTREELTMCLHALEYSGPQWHFRTQLPAWATSFVPPS